MLLCQAYFTEVLILEHNFTFLIGLLLLYFLYFLKTSGNVDSFSDCFSSYRLLWKCVWKSTNVWFVIGTQAQYDCVLIQVQVIFKSTDCIKYLQQNTLNHFAVVWQSTFFSDINMPVCYCHSLDFFLSCHYFVSSYPVRLVQMFFFLKIKTTFHCSVL